MQITRTWILAGAVAALIGCSGNYSTGPTTGNGNGGNGSGGGPAGSVTVGNIFFQSAQDGSRNPAQNTVAVGQPVTWTWTSTGSTSHSVQSVGSPSFQSSGILSGNGMTYTFTFTQPGTYHYQCAVHGSAMSGTVIVQ